MQSLKSAIYYMLQHNMPAHIIFEVQEVFDSDLEQQIVNIINLAGFGSIIVVYQRRGDATAQREEK